MVRLVVLFRMALVPYLFAVAQVRRWQNRQPHLWDQGFVLIGTVDGLACRIPSGMSTIAHDMIISAIWLPITGRLLPAVTIEVRDGHRVLHRVTGEPRIDAPNQRVVWIAQPKITAPVKPHSTANIVVKINYAGRHVRSHFHFISPRQRPSREKRQKKKEGEPEPVQ